MNIVTTEVTRTDTASPVSASTRTAAINGLAVVGFIALVVAGMGLAVSAARYVPSAVSSLGAAAVSLSSIFSPAEKPALTVIPGTSTTTIPFDTGGATSTPATSTPTGTTPVTPTKPAGTPVATTPGTPTSGTYPINGTTAPATLYGLPDFVTSITAVGYLTSASTDSFVAANTIPANAKVAVKFTITNKGTNTTGAWRFSASIPTATAYIFQSLPQQALQPGDHIDYVLGFDQATAGSNKTISVTANFDNAIVESTTNNNSASASVTILGS